MQVHYLLTEFIYLRRAGSDRSGGLGAGIIRSVRGGCWPFAVDDRIGVDI